MTSISLAGATARFHGADKPGYCLQDVDAAILQGRPSLRGHSEPTAIHEWDDSPGKHPGANAPSGGFPIYFSMPKGFGDVGMSLDNDPNVGLFIDTENGVYKKGVIGIQTFAQRIKQLGGGEFLGYSDEFLGYELVGVTPPPVLAPSTGGMGALSGSGWAFNIPAAAVQKDIQLSLTHRGRYAGPVNGIWGVKSVEGIQITIKQAGFYTGPIDGIPGANTCRGVQEYAKRFGGYTGPINAVLGINGWNGFMRGVKK